MTAPLARTTAPRVEQAGLWHALPSTLAAVIRPEISVLAGQILDEIQRQIPEYARPLDPQYRAVIKRGVEEALHQFADQIADPSVPQLRRAEVYRALGRYEMREGRSLDSLQRAYRLGARMGWRRFMSIGARVELPRRSLLLLGEAILAHIDDLAALSVDGYAEEQANEAGTLARRRRRLLELLLSEPIVGQRRLEEAAGAAQWRLPSAVVIAALEPLDDCDEVPSVRWPALVDLECSEPHAIVPVEGETPSAAQWEKDFPGWRVAFSDPVQLSESAGALRWARRVLMLARDGAIAEQPVIRCDEHLPSVMLLNDPLLMRELAKHRLAPLNALKEKQRVRLGRTLLSWLQARNGAPEVAARLGIHPQTVRYRLRQLEELFGGALHDPDTRFGLEMALRGMALIMRDGQNRPPWPAHAAGGEEPGSDGGPSDDE